ncbi:cupin domain-containing protein [Flavobacteriaceae bacterium KMM 6898]|nr:cupin domain-containing protein [Flavobacteriaceae bacterium KMM 6898]
MYQIDNRIRQQDYAQLQVLKIVNTDAFDILSISLEKDAIFPDHTSPTNAHLVVLEGEILFYINHTSYQLKEQQHFNFPKNTNHWVKATTNSKFLIIR